MNKERGYIALISTIVISVLLITITVVIGMNNMFVRFNILDSESKEISRALAEACVDQAMLDAFHGDYYSTLTNFSIPGTSYTCKRKSYFSGNDIIIESQGEFNDSFTNLKVTVDSFTFNETYYKECSHFDSPC